MKNLPENLIVLGSLDFAALGLYPQACFNLLFAVYIAVRRSRCSK